MFHVGISYEDGEQGNVYSGRVLEIDFQKGTATLVTENFDRVVIATGNAWLPGFTSKDRDVHQIIVYS